MTGPKLYAGTSGFAYPSWKPDFYPQSLSPAKFLAHYASRLNAVEANYTYRKIAAATTFEKWVASTPDAFLFLPKAHMKITHSLKLKQAEEFTRYFLDSLAPLATAGRLGPILFQLAPTHKADAETLAEFLKGLPKSIRPTFEFRHPSWFDERVFQILRDANAGLCLAENEKLETPEILTTDFVYLRLRKSDYLEAELADVISRAKHYLSNGKTVYAIFKHEDTPAGAANAVKLLEAVAKR